MKSWTIRVDDANLQGATFALQSKGDCYLSANTKLVSIDKAVRLSSEELARQFCKSTLPTLTRRHGDDISLTVAYLIEPKPLAQDDALVVARMESGNFAPNKRPASV